VVGTVVYGDTDEYAEAFVTLIGEGKKITTETNFFGDFEFENLSYNTDYTVIVEAKSYKTRKIMVNTAYDVCLNIIL
jgi:hypothetical protein